MTYFPKNVMSLILSYNDASAQRAERTRLLEPIKEALELKEKYTKRFERMEGVGWTFRASVVDNLCRDGMKRWKDYLQLYVDEADNLDRDRRKITPEQHTIIILLTNHSRTRPISQNRHIPLKPYQHVRKPELLQYCRDNKIKGYSKFNKKDLYTYIIKQQYF